jgi:hypothetical protein
MIVNPPRSQHRAESVPEERSHISMRIRNATGWGMREARLIQHAPILHGRIDGQGRLGNLLAGKIYVRYRNACARISA